MSDPKPSSPHSLQIGSIVADKYRIERVLGQGGMGFVYAAEHTQLGHSVALKVLRASAAESAEAVQRFLREGRAVARLKSEHIAAVSDVGTLSSGEPFLVMELLEGRDLAQVMAERVTLPIEEAVDYVLQACEALAVAHGKGIVHRDLKPANLFLTSRPDGEPLIKVLDFGISKTNALDTEAAAITLTATIVGTPKYMSPEQIQDSRAVDGRSDIWALGVILYEVLTGVRPFHASTLAMTCVKILNEHPPAPSAHRADVPAGLDTIIQRCLEKAPEQRWGSVAELAEALAPFASPTMMPVIARIGRIVAGTGSTETRGAYARNDMSGAYSAASVGVRSTTGESPSSPSAGSAPRDAISTRTPAAGAGRPLSDSASMPTLQGAAGDEASASQSQKKKGGAVWIAAALAVVVVALLLFALRGGGGSNDHANAAPAPTKSAATAGAADPQKSGAVSASASSTGTAATPPTTDSAAKPADTNAVLPASTSASAPAPTKPNTLPAVVGARPNPGKPTAPGKPTTSAAPVETAPPPTPPPPPKPTGGTNVLDDRR